jgi:sialic acid synthase
MTRELTIDNVTINDDSDSYIIAEIGNNHQGNLQKCRDIIKVAKECGANAVKLQKRDNHALFTKEMYDSPYDNRNSFAHTYGKHRDFLEFGEVEYKDLIEYCRELDITFFSTAFDMPSADFLAKLDLPAYKIASGDLTNIPLIKHVASFEKPLIISSGGGTMDDVVRAYEAIMPINQNLCIMQCTSAYPADYNQLNLRVIETFYNRFPDVVIGYSGHDNGIAMPLVAYMLGARIVEKHFTLNRTWKGTDQVFSLAPDGLRKMVRDLKRARISLGSAEKTRIDAEEGPMHKMNKKLVAARVLPAGYVLTRDDILIKAPGDGMPPYKIEEVIGKVLKAPLNEEQNISEQDLGDAL